MKTIATPALKTEKSPPIPCVTYLFFGTRCFKISWLNGEIVDLSTCLNGNRRPGVGGSSKPIEQISFGLLAKELGLSAILQAPQNCILVSSDETLLERRPAKNVTKLNLFFTLSMLVCGAIRVAGTIRAENPPKPTQTEDYRKLDSFLSFLRKRNAEQYAIRSDKAINEANYVMIGGICAF